MNDQLGDLNRLRSFLMLAEMLHFGHAANQLSITQSALSQQLRKLENEVGACLFKRGSNVAIELTPAGEAMLEPVRRCLKESTDVLHAVRSAQRGESRTVRLGYGVMALETVLHSLLRTVDRRFPGLHVELEENVTSALLRAVREKILDVAIICSPPLGEPEFVSHVVCRERMVAVVPSDHPAIEPTQVGLKKLAQESFVLLRRQDTPAYYDATIAFCRNAGFSPRVRHEVTGLSTMLNLVAAGKGVTAVPTSIVRLLPRGVRPIDVETMPATFDLAMIRRRDNQSAALELIWRVLMEISRNDPPQPAGERPTRPTQEATARLSHSAAVRD